MSNDYNLPLGVSLTIVDKEDRDHYAEVLSSSEIRYVELGLNVSPNRHLTQTQADHLQSKLMFNLKSTCKAIRDSGAKITSCHMPFGAHFDISNPDYLKLDKTISKLAKIMKKAEKYAKPNYFVFHPGSPEWTLGEYHRGALNEEEREARFQAVVYSLAMLSRTTTTPIAIENMPQNLLCNFPEEHRLMIDRINTLNLKQGYYNAALIGAVVDVNHCSHRTPERTIEIMDEKIFGVHISDTKEGQTDMHLTPGKGDLDFNGIIGALQNIGYNGIFTYETKDSGRTMNIPWNKSNLFSSYNKSLEQPVELAPTESHIDASEEILKHFNFNFDKTSTQDSDYSE